MRYYLANQKAVAHAWERHILTFKNGIYSCLCYNRPVPYFARESIGGEEYDDRGRTELKVKRRL